MKLLIEKISCKKRSYADRVDIVYYNLYQCPKCNKEVVREARSIRKTCVHCNRGVIKNNSLRQLSMVYGVHRATLLGWIKKDNKNYKEILL